MGYDRFPEGLIDEKERFLEQAMEANAMLVYPHDPRYAASFLEYNPVKNRIKPVGPVRELKMAV